MAKKCCRSDPPCKYCPKRAHGKKKGKHLDVAQDCAASCPQPGKVFFLLRTV